MRKESGNGGVIRGRRLQDRYLDREVLPEEGIGLGMEVRRPRHLAGYCESATIGSWKGDEGTDK